MTTSSKLSLSTRRDLAAVRLHWKALAMLLVSSLSLFFAAMTVPPGPVTKTLSCIALLFLLVTAWARGSDIPATKHGWMWDGRRQGFVLVAMASIILLFDSSPVAWGEVFLHWGVAFVWFTTPNGRPWWSWIWGLPYEQDDQT